MVEIEIDANLELGSLTVEIPSVPISLPCRQWPLVLCHFLAHPHYSPQMTKRAEAPCLLNLKCTYGHFGTIDAMPRFVILAGRHLAGYHPHDARKEYLELTSWSDPMQDLIMQHILDRPGHCIVIKDCNPFQRD
jgi:hypothetical protein